MISLESRTRLPRADEVVEQIDQFVFPSVSSLIGVGEVEAVSAKPPMMGARKARRLGSPHDLLKTVR